LAAVGFDDGLDDGKAETGAVRGGIEAIELVEDVGFFARGDAGAVVEDEDADLIGGGLGVDFDGCADGGVLDGILDEVLEGCREELGLGAEEWEIGGEVSGDGVSVELIEEWFEDFFDGAPVEIELDAGLVEAGHFEQG
jgi:hypothetical protein